MNKSKLRLLIYLGIHHTSIISVSNWLKYIHRWLSVELLKKKSRIDANQNVTNSNDNSWVNNDEVVHCFAAAVGASPPLKYCGWIPCSSVVLCLRSDSLKKSIAIDLKKKTLTNAGMRISSNTSKSFKNCMWSIGYVEILGSFNSIA